MPWTFAMKLIYRVDQFQIIFDFPEMPQTPKKNPNNNNNK